MSEPKRPTARVDAAWCAAQRQAPGRMFRPGHWRRTVERALHGGVHADEIVAVVEDVTAAVVAGSCSRHYAWRAIEETLRALTAARAW